MVTRVDHGELIVCCLQGEGIAALAPVVYRIAQRNGLRAIRFFTRRPALARLLLACGLGFETQETVYRCEVLPHE